MGWPLLVVEGVEADDVIATLAKEATLAGIRTVVSTGDKDLAQLVDPHVTLINTMSNETLDEAAVKAKFGVAPEQIVDYLALVGDSVDNIPGVEKVGPKTAAKWIAQYGSLEGVLAHADEITGVVGDNLRQARDWLGKARELVTVKHDVALPFKVADLAPRERDRERLAALFQRFGFKSWLRDVQGNGDSPAATPAPSAPSASAVAPADVPRRYETLLTEADLARWIAAARRGRDRVVRHRDHLARPVRGPARRRLVLDRARRGRVPRHRPRVSRRAGPARRRSCARPPQALARGRGEEEARSEHQVRRARAREPRREARRNRARHAAPVLRPREQRAARHGLARRALPRPEDDHLRRGHRQGRAADRLRAGGRRARDRVLGRGCRRHAAAASHAVPEGGRRREAQARLRDDRDAGARSAVPDGARRRADRRRGARAPEPRARPEDARARAEGLHRGRAVVQPQLAEADRRDLLRAPEAPGDQEDAERRAVDRRGRAREARARLSAAEDAARVPVGVQAQVDLHRQAAADGEPADRPRAHQLRPGDGGDRPAGVERSQPPEHPGAHARGAPDPRGLHRAAAACDRVGRLLADRAAHHGAPLGGQGPARRLRARRGHPPRDRGRDLRPQSAGGDRPRSAATRRRSTSA